MTTLLKISQMLLGGCALLLFSGALPRVGVPAVYHGGAMLSLGVLGTLLTLWAGLRLAQVEPRSFWCGSLYALLSAASFSGALWATRLTYELLLVEGSSWLKIFCLIDLILLAIASGLFFAYHGYRKLTKRHWLALAHLSLIPLALGSYLDYCFEVSHRIPVLANEPAPIESVRLSDERSIPLGFKLSFGQFELDHYNDAPYTIYEQKGNEWMPLGTVTEQGNELVYGEERWSKELLEYPASTDYKAIMLIKGEPARVILQQDATVKDYRVSYTLDCPQEESAIKGILRVNEPIEYRGWQFTLMNYHRIASSRQTVIQLEARRAPGRFWARSGMIALLVCIAAWCWLPAQAPKRSLP